MRIHRIFPGDVRGAQGLNRKLAKAKAAGSTALWLAREDYQRAARLGWLTTWEQKIFVEEPWVAPPSKQGTPPVDDRVERVRVARGNETELGRWRENGARHLLLRPTEKITPRAFARALRDLDPADVYFEFLPWRKEYPRRFTAPEIRDFLRALRIENPSMVPSIFPGLEAWDDRIAPDLELEASREIVVRGPAVAATAPRFSIVIPTYDNELFVTSVLRAALAQEYPQAEYEIIVVDDGSTDGTVESLRALVRDNVTEVPVTILHFPRERARAAGDHLYRAGIARNLGARYARGEWLVFLDSDILVGPKFLERVAMATGAFDVIQCQRFHILPELCERPLAYKDVDQGRQIYVEEENYWAPFFETRDWESIPAFWKYTCTYALALRRRDFFEVGRFKRNYTTYGFEDVDLGYELARLGRKFHLLDERTLHLTPPAARSEYGHSAWRRHRLLSRTAKNFFRQHLDPEIFDLLGTFMYESAWWHRLWFAGRRA